MIDIMKKDVQNKFINHPKRYEHILGVVKTATHLALKHGIDEKKAYIAALFHDYTKYDALETQKSLLTKQEIKTYEHNPIMYHALSAAAYLKETYLIEDEDILNAIKYHVFGRLNMSMLDKIILIADKTEPHRTYSSVEKLRTLAQSNIDEAILFYLIDLKMYHPNMHRDQQTIIDEIIKSIGE